MIKINLITKAEQQQLDALRSAHQFYVDNFDPAYKKRMALKKIEAVLKLMDNAMEFARSMLIGLHDAMEKRYGKDEPAGIPIYPNYTSTNLLRTYHEKGIEDGSIPIRKTLTREYYVMPEGHPDPKVEVVMGYEAGNTCNRDGCQGIIAEHEPDGCCSCHIAAPCGVCCHNYGYCDTCGWDADDEPQP